MIYQAVGNKGVIAWWSMTVQMRSKIVVIIIVLLGTMIPVPMAELESPVTVNENLKLTESNLIAYTQHGPIDITSDAEFIMQASVEGWPGEGSESNPYKIDGYNITHMGYSIRIVNVTIPFEITNCYLASNSAGVLIEGSSDCRVYYNIFDNASVEICDSNNCEVYSNGFHSDSGIIINRCSHVSVTDVEVIAPSNQGILVTHSSHCTISSNILNSSTTAAIVALDSISCNITSNIISHCQDGIRIGSDTSSSLFTNNYIYNQTEYGIRIESGSDNWIYANLVASEGAGFFLDDGNQNHWDDGFFLGNFLPGITEGIFQIDGSAESVDQFARPICPEPIQEPVICSDPIIVKLGNFEGILACAVWLRAATSRFWYWIAGCAVEIDGEMNQGVECTGPCTIMIPIHDLEAGIHEISLTLYLNWFGFLGGEIHIADASFFLPGFYSPYDGDNDGMVDEWEVENNLDPYLDDSELDPDHDNFLNNQEVYWATDPHNPDSDQDQMPDGWEAFYELQPCFDDSRDDRDSDDLSNLDEFLHGTNPLNSDSDFDSITDGWEVTYGQNPLDSSDAPLDSDSDTLTNLQEFQLGTDPTNPDSDLDTFPDAWEVRNGFDPCIPSDTLYEQMFYYSPFIATVYLTLFAVAAVTLIVKRKVKVLRQEQVQYEEEEEIKRHLQSLLS
ncbi:MAG: NosD domain-containing protein [Promethearchaeota archaeon]